jgi:hypothetical protein
MRDLAKAYKLLNKKLNIYIKLFCKYIPGQEVRVGSSRKTLEISGNMEAIFRSESLRIFSVDFRLTSHSFRQETPVNHRKNPKIFRLEYCFHFSSFSGHFVLGSYFALYLAIK